MTVVVRPLLGGEWAKLRQLTGSTLGVAGPRNDLYRALLQIVIEAPGTRWEPLNLAASCWKDVTHRLVLVGYSVSILYLATDGLPIAKSGLTPLLADGRYITFQSGRDT